MVQTTRPGCSSLSKIYPLLPYHAPLMLASVEMALAKGRVRLVARL